MSRAWRASFMGHSWPAFMFMLMAGAPWARALTGPVPSPGMNALAASAVMTLVRLAGCIGSWSLPASITLPVSASTRIHDLGGGGGGGVVGGGAAGPRGGAPPRGAEAAWGEGERRPAEWSLPYGRTRRRARRTARARSGVRRAVAERSAPQG